jgi:CBS domain-containing protein
MKGKAMITVKDLMCTDVQTLKPTDSIHEARQLMLEQHVRHVPIVENGKFVGLLTKHDILAVSVSSLAEIDSAQQDELDSAIPISEVMMTDVIIADADASLLEAANVMLTQQHGCLPVVRNEKLLGILTEADFVRLAIYLMERLDHYNAKPHKNEENALKH